ncbi:MAG: hypothetical protein FWC87_03415 [Acidimicrobiaceae bacterium]|nr:hypothetical protein [Acidimicrobiaceae bacterium]
MDAKWRYITATVTNGRLTFVGPPPLPELRPDAPMTEICASLLEQGWEYLEFLSTPDGIVLRHDDAGVRRS